VGDLINDYEGIGGYQAYRSQLRLLYFASVDPGSGGLITLRMVPMLARRMRLERAALEDSEWLRSILEHNSRSFGTRVDREGDGTLLVRAK
jgi:poly-gamma-glutamate capsule biosynthesis protein CapA/YwtB (metallophosphatase superfamily)